ncbi:maestro heat-like repeat-containing protein family member 1 [Hemiscyllium ocellatum]|uniref:maestro heat-like repeat-containing protein family member 1 n=1 Tax=Hemiscyllium ocellatum TaxID=170820 RepID=UPI0029668B83|nr:maestro heat-like repeat-containing protein family member 1 [Hemiscyllium ocellatum]
MAACNVESSLKALRDAASDRDEAVRRQIVLSLRELGAHHTDLLLTSCLNYLSKHGQLEEQHRAVILGAMRLVVEDAGSQVSELTAKQLVAAAARELVRPDEALSEASKEAYGDLLVALGGSYTEEVLDKTLRSIKADRLPDPSLVRTVARLALASGGSMAPYLSAIFEALVPMLSQAKTDRMRVALATALGLLSRSVLQHQEAQAQKKWAFRREIHAAYDTLFNAWLPLKEPRLRLEVLTALGEVVQVLGGDKLREELPRLLPAVVSLYRKQQEPFHVSHLLRQALEVAHGTDPRGLEAQVEGLLHPLHHQACQPADPESDLAPGNREELLACFSVATRASPDAVLKFLVHKLANSERSRLGTLAVLRHLVVTEPRSLEGRKASVLAGIRAPLQDPAGRVKRALLDLIEALAERGYLELEGGAAAVDFVVCQCGLAEARAPAKAREASDGELKETAEGLLHRMAGLERLTPMLWPSLLEYVTPAQHTHALPAVCRALQLAVSGRRRPGLQLFELNYDKRPSLPSPQALVARLLVAASLPYEGQQRGEAALGLLLALGPTIHPALEGLWAAELPTLLRYLAEHTEETVAQQQWEKNLLLLLFRTAETVGNAQWTGRLAEEMTNQINAWQGAPLAYAHVSREKQFLYKCLGIMLQHTQSAETIHQQLQEMLLSAQHGEALEREGLAIGVGFCAMTHFEATLARLEEFVRLDALRKTVSFFSSLVEKVDGDLERMKSTLILCYGYVALYAPEELLMPRLEAGILQHVVGLASTKVLGIKVETKDPTVKLSLIKAVTLVAKAVHANRWRHSYPFTRKAELLATMQGLIKAEARAQLKTPVCQLAMTACACLIRLEPLVNRAYVTELIKTCLDSVLGLQPPEKAGEDGREAWEREELYRETAAALQGLLNEILMHVLSPDGLQAVFRHVEGWVISTRDHERERALDITAQLATLYLEKMALRGEVEFSHLGTMVGRLVPRCTDPVPRVRRLAVGSIYTLFRVHLRYAGLPEGEADELVEHLKAVGARLEQAESQALLRGCSELAKVIARRLPQEQVSTLLFVLFEGLDDPHVACSSAASIVMNTVVRSCGAVLEGHVSEILKALYIRLQWIAGEQVKLSMVHFICVLASQNTAEVVSCLLCTPLPFDGYTCEIWRALAGEATLASRCMELLLEALGKHLAPSERPGGSLVHKSGAVCSALEPLAIVCALGEMLSNPESVGAVRGLYPQLVATLLLHLSSSVGVEFPQELFHAGDPRHWKVSPSRSKQSTVDVCGYSVETLKAALTVGRTEAVVTDMEESGAWALLQSSEGHHQGVALLARAVAHHVRPQLAAIAHRLSAALPAAPKPQRVTLAAFLGQLLSEPVASELQLTDVLLAGLLGCADDAVPIVRLLCFRALGRAVAATEGELGKVGLYADRLARAMIAGVSGGEDPRDLVKVEALGSLSGLLALLDEGQARGLLADVILAAQPLFEHGSEQVRGGAFRLFGSLARFGEGELRHLYVEQAHASLVSLILHLNDSSGEVVQACKAAVRSAGPLLGSDSLCSLFQRELADGGELDYWAFLGSLAKAVAEDFPAKVSIYLAVGATFFKSLLPEVRGNAVAFAASLLQRLPRKYHQAAANSNICGDIAAMLQDPVSSVRVKAARALSLLH